MLCVGEECICAVLPIIMSKIEQETQKSSDKSNETTSFQGMNL